jgi:hypothetical protein
MKVYEQLTPRHIELIAAQHMFFVATAPLAQDGHVNVSPKGYDSFYILDPTRVAYIDLGGSGMETQAHLQENARISLMFCSFDATPIIVRLYGRGTAHAYGTAGFEALRPHFPSISVPVRAIIEVALTRVQDSCGWGVPFYEFKGERPKLREMNAQRTQEAKLERCYTNNAQSIDGLPGFQTPKS